MTLRRHFLPMLLVIAITFFLTGCAVTASQKDLNDSIIGVTGYKAFMPTDPLPSPLVTFYDSTGQLVTKAWATMSNEQVRKLLAAIHSDISIAKKDSSGNLSYLVAKTTAQAGNYRVVMDYAQYMPESVVDSTTKKELGQGRVGVGMRMTADIRTSAANIDLGSLFALGVAAASNKLTGTMSVDIYGIGSTDIGNLFVTSAKIDESSIQKTLEAMAAIKAKIPDSGTTLTPYILAVKPTAPDVTPAEVKKSLL